MLKAENFNYTQKINYVDEYEELVLFQKKKGAIQFNGMPMTLLRGIQKEKPDVVYYKICRKFSPRNEKLFTRNPQYTKIYFDDGRQPI